MSKNIINILRSKFYEYVDPENFHPCSCFTFNNPLPLPLHIYFLAVSRGEISTDQREYKSAGVVVVYCSNPHSPHHRLLADETSKKFFRSQEISITDDCLEINCNKLSF